MFFGGFSSLVVRHCPKLQSCVISRKTNDGNLRKWRKTYLVSSPVLGPRFFFVSFTSTSHTMQFKEKLKDQACENGKKFGPQNFFVVLLTPAVRYCGKLSSSDSNSGKWQKTSFLGLNQALWVVSLAQNDFIGRCLEKKLEKKNKNPETRFFLLNRPWTYFKLDDTPTLCKKLKIPTISSREKLWKNGQTDKQKQKN